MLEQAIVDATALKEAAIKNAESIIIEKYANDIKDVVSTLLEQPEDEPFPEPEEGDEDLELDIEEPEEEPGGEEVDGQVPPAYPAGDVSGEQVDAVRDSVRAAEDALKDVEEKLDDLEMTAKAGDEEEQIEVDMKQLRSEMGAEEMEPEDLHDRPPLGEEVEVEVEESVLNDILEDLIVDIKPQKTGWMMTPDSVLDHAFEQALAREEDTEIAEENEELKSVVKKLQKENKQLESKIDTVDEKNKKLVQTIIQLKEKFDETNLSNGRLLYTNKILGSTSLNERQKTRIVEAISNAENIEEAKVIYETLQSATGNIREQKMPQSLSEAVTRNSNSSLLLSRRKREEPPHQFTDRMKKLAGIS
ncbi:MAG: hypothetical protein CMI54_00015 [Parcubacteria group bacterium]|nr:hypothetical protein [Parcubacteria group bacterium]|tara:strand:+ start:55 stop:1137 length:1083 start_codon:yes stop_codon:yes gene_type:complete